MKKKNFFLFLLILIPVSSVAQEKIKNYELQEVPVIGKRKFQDLGITKTEVDTLILKESISNSLADILSQNTSVFIKNYGRGTLSTASFRGTAPSHTQVLWNGLKINSPMLGQVDFSLIPSYFIDDMSLWHGASSVNVVGGGLGGAITLDNKPVKTEGYDVTFIQGISSFKTFDEYLHFRYVDTKWQSSTRICFVNSKNDFKYTNYNKRNLDMESETGEIVYPVEKNKNCNYQDFHILQELYYRPNEKNNFSLAGWFMHSNRGIPMLNVNYREEDESKNEQNQITARAVGSWGYISGKLKLNTKLGYTFDNTLYTYKGESGTDRLVVMTHANSIVYSGNAQFSADYFLSDKWMFSANTSVDLNSVSSFEKSKKEGYEKQRAEATLFGSVRYKPHPRIGMALNLREDYYGKFTPIIPAAFIDFSLWPKYQLIFKSSITRNYHYPSLNDLYFLPGGNKDLKSERGFTYDLGLEFEVKRDDIFSFKGEVTAYDAYIDDWIIWLPTFKGFWEPHNVKQVHSYGWELKGSSNVKLGKWSLFLNANWAQTRSINQGDPMNWADESIGKQLVYIPEYSSSVMGKLSWKGYSFIYKYNYYSERYTTSSNEKDSKIGRLGSYYMNDISLEKLFSTRPCNISLKFSVYNLFNEEYVSVLSRPMPGRNYGFFISIHPKWKNKSHTK